MNNPIDNYVTTALQSYTVLAIVALLIGAAVAPYAVAVAESNENHVVVVSIDEPITASSGQQTVQEIRSLRNNDSVKAVVLDINTPGGSAAASESMYMAIKRLSDEKPVYTSVGSSAASGGYYAAIASDKIYVTPGSLVGSVGVRASVPSSGGLPPGVTTGPDKAGAMTQDEWYAAIESMQRSFVGSVMQERGDNLTVDRETVAEATIYVGGRAVNTGYADEIGNTEDAIAAAAEDAGVSDYQVSYRDPAQPQLSLLGLNTGDDTNSTVTVDQAPMDDNGIDRVRFLMLFGTLENERILYNSTDQGGVRDE
ncbi:S49 family peptidase [Haloarcula salinisoli]|uniref:S49 family peptidase n=1 Tax=Haloarcula salinisoli TaxID=2487746 RepID=A0A8J7YJT0_9EURY|nr:S49 family peptidase [Halomicroarcula salinisoli]MBX0287662.1 S49 family peptidase [Halomicroarcula salinisoli]MBX0304591.1 S49 family peptidase [Halomicroarcula salinisoli]